MKYSEARPLFKSGDLVSFSHGGWGSLSDIKASIVRMFTRSTYSHVGVVCRATFPAGGDRVFLLEAVKPKARVFPLSLLGDFYWLPMKAVWNQPAEEFGISRIGINYSEFTAMKAPFETLGSDNAQECAAYAMNILSRAGIDLGTMATPDAVVLAAQALGAELFLVQNDNLEQRATQ